MQQLIWCLIALLLIYGSWQFLCALRAGSEQRVPLSSDANSGALRGLSDDLFNYAPISEQKPISSQTVTVYANGQTDAMRNAAKGDALDPAFDPFALELELQRIRREIGSMREVFEAQQREIDILRADIKRLTEPTARRTVPEPIEPDVSPEYDEALALARRGVLASVIAERCGITQAEADLVASLAARSRREGTLGEFL